MLYENAVEDIDWLRTKGFWFGPFTLALCYFSSEMGVAGPSGASGNGSASNPDQKFYDDLYFDSDEEEGDDEKKLGGTSSGKTERGRSKNREVKSNDDLMYDPDMDDEDQAWVDNIRKQYQSKLKV
jgi:hypothetical protein